MLQISHGMIEDMERYDHFARFMAARGILVCGNDHLGHGLTARNKSEMGYMYAYDASKTMAADVHPCDQMHKTGISGSSVFPYGTQHGIIYCKKIYVRICKRSKVPCKAAEKCQHRWFYLYGNGRTSEVYAEDWRGGSRSGEYAPWREA